MNEGISVCHDVSFVSISKLKLNSVALVCERTVPTERPLLVSEVSANFLHGLVVRVPGFRSRGPGFGSQCYQIS
jgi:hypothetical protein